MADENNNLSFLYNNPPNQYNESDFNQQNQQQYQNQNNQYNQFDNNQQMYSQSSFNSNQYNNQLSRHNSEVVNNQFKINLNDTMPDNSMHNMQQNYSNSRGRDPQEQNQMMLNEIHDFYSRDEMDNDNEYKTEAKKKAASEFRQYMMSKFPNRYFILKKITSKNDLWQQICQDKNWVVIDEVNQAKK